MDKQLLINIIIAQLEQIHQVAVSATQAAIDDATDEETIPENKYDTLALEAAYLAHGQALRVQECEMDIQQYKKLLVTAQNQGGSVAIGTLVELIDEDDYFRFLFMGPCAGGVGVQFEQKEVVIITPKAPLGQAMLGKQTGDEVMLEIAGKQICYEIVSIN